MRKLMVTTDSVPLLVIRLTLGVVIFPHGAQKVFGWFGGGGIDGTIQHFQQSFGLPAWIAVLVMAAELLGSLALVLGVLGRVAALGIGGVMLGAMFIVHLPYGFFMNWQGSQSGEGFEYHLLALGMVLAVLIGGSGAASIDRAVIRR